MRIIQLFLLVSCLGILHAGIAAAELKVLDKPMWMLPGQQIRIALEQPEGSGELTVEVPPTLELFDHWDKDSIQRFYFRVVGAGDATLRFSGAGGDLEMPLEVVAWGDIHTPREFKDVQLPRIWPMNDRDFDDIKTRRTMHSDEEIRQLRENGTVSGRARRWLEASDDEVYNIIPGPSIPRTGGLILVGADPNRGVGKGCPVCGMDLYEGRSGFYPWEYSTNPQDWKIRCPSCGTAFPSNDFRAGDMHSGPFPDDGFGCEPIDPVRTAEQPEDVEWRWPFIAYYHQHAAYMREFTPGIIETARAYVATGDERYAHKCAIALLRYSESMLDMSLNLKHRKSNMRHRGGGFYRWPVGAPQEKYFHQLEGSFSYIQPNWDTPRMEDAARAWDLVFDAIEGNEELLRFAQRNHHPEIQTIEDFRRFIEAGVIRVPVQMGMDNAVARNWPQQELMVASIALCLGTEASLDVADWLLNEEDMRFAVTNLFYRDGSAYESGNYNLMHIRHTLDMANSLDRLTGLYPEKALPPRFISLTDNPKTRRLFDFPLEASLIGRSTPTTGDSGKGGPSDELAWKQGLPCGLSDWITAYRLTGDRRFAQAMYGPEGSLVEAIDDPDLRAAAVEAGTQFGGLVQTESNMLGGYGYAILRSGEQDEMRALWMRYSRNLGHSHSDMLTYGLSAFKSDLLPDLGYPEGWSHAGYWAANWGTHYMTKITGLRSTHFNRADLTTFAGQSPVQVAAAEGFADLDGERCARQRTMALVDLSPSEFYVLTVERVEGGQEHTFSFHGPHGTATAEGVAMEAYEGTALGEGLEYGDISPAEERDPELACLAFMYEPTRGTPEGVWSVDTSVGGRDALHLRMTSVYPEGGDLVIAKGRNPLGGQLYEMPWVTLRSTGDAPLNRQYVNVIEPCEGESAIRSIERVAVSGGAPDAQFEPLALQVTTDEFTDTIILQHEAGPMLTANGISFDGEFGVWRERGDQMDMMALVRGTTITRGEMGVALEAAEYTGTIVSCEYDRHAIVISPAPSDPDAMPGRHMRITNAEGNSVSLQVKTAEPVEEGWRVTFDLDPLIGEGLVGECGNGVVVSDTFLRLHPFGYYAGKTLMNETGEVAHRISDVAGGHECRLITGDDGAVGAADLDAQFVDLDGDGLRRFLIYDYGLGDRVTVESWAIGQGRR